MQITAAGVAYFYGDGGSVTNINGGNLTTGSITADKIAADTITADKIAAGAVGASEISAGAITADKIAAGAVTADKFASGSVNNLIRNSECRVGVDDWRTAGGAGINFNYPGWSLMGESATCFYTVAGTPASGTVAFALRRLSRGRGQDVRRERLSWVACRLRTNKRPN